MMLSEVVLKITRTQLDHGPNMVLSLSVNIRKIRLLVIMTMLITFIRYSFEILPKLCSQICGAKCNTYIKLQLTLFCNLLCDAHLKQV